MSNEFTPLLYIRLRKRITLKQGRPITLSDVAQFIAPAELEEDLAKLELLRPRQEDGNLLLVDMLLIIRKLKARYPDLTIELFGEPHALVELANSRKPVSPLLSAFVWLLLFIGSGLAIMNFHADVSMMEVHRKVYELVTGDDVEHPYWLQIPYSIGLGAGMVLFFNRWFRKKFNEEPSPLDVEMYLYQENMNQYVITEEYGKLRNREGREPTI